MAIQLSDYLGGLVPRVEEFNVLVAQQTPLVRRMLTQVEDTALLQRAIDEALGLSDTSSSLILNELSRREISAVVIKQEQLESQQAENKEQIETIGLQADEFERRHQHLLARISELTRLNSELRKNLQTMLEQQKQCREQLEGFRSLENQVKNLTDQLGEEANNSEKLNEMSEEVNREAQEEIKKCKQAVKWKDYKGNASLVAAAAVVVAAPVSVPAGIGFTVVFLFGCYIKKEAHNVEAIQVQYGGERRGDLVRETAAKVWKYMPPIRTWVRTGF